jgi:PAS domain S-box-containing protein
VSSEEARLRLLVESVRDYAIFMMDPEGRVTTWSAGAERLTGYRADEILGRHFSVFHAPEDLRDGKPARELTAAAAEGRFEDEGWRLRKDGSRFWATVVITALRDEKGRLVGFGTITRDLTERRQAEVALRESAMRLAGTIESAMDAIIAIGADQRITAFNPAAERMFRCLAADVLGQPLDRLIPERFRRAHAGHVRAFGRTGVTARSMSSPGELVGLRADGEEFPIEATISQFEMRGQKVFTVIVRDITERKRAEASLRESEARLAGIIGSAMDAIITIDAEQRITVFNRAAEQIFQCPAQEALGRPIDRFIPARFRGAHGEHIRAFGRTGVTSRSMWTPGELVGLRASGEEFPIEATISQIEAGDQRLFTVILRDITERKRADAERAEILARERAARAAAEAAEARAVLLAEASTVLASSFDYGSTLATVARLTVPRLADWSVVDLVDGDGGPTRRQAVASGDPAKSGLAEALRSFSVGPDGEHPVAKALRTGELQFVQEVSDAWLRAIATDAEHLRVLRELAPRAWISVPLVARARTFGALTFVAVAPERRFGPADLGLAAELARRVAVAVDNARLYREAQEAIQVRDQFLSIASHELKTPLTPLQLHVHKLQRSLARNWAATPPEQLVSQLEAMARQVRRMTGLVDNLLDISRLSAGRMDLELAEVDLVAVVREVAGRFEPELERTGVALHVRAEGSVTGFWDETRVEQIVTNLLSNALKYGMGQPVEISVAAEGDAAALTVRDFGIGIAPEHQARIFGQFERAVSGRAYGGFGLGLWIVRRLAEVLGGTVSVASAPGEGSTFRVVLPRSGPAEARAIA